MRVSTRSRPKAAGILVGAYSFVIGMFQHTAARRRLGINPPYKAVITKFQHTAARRRLAMPASMASS